jgi:predicted AlkP superfamily pyrophosphatase or phosphodiesterase
LVRGIDMKAIVIVWDGLRPEFVRRDLTPTLCSLADRGVTFTNHSAVFPTETRVNSSSLATGCYPDRHGMVANRFWDRDMAAFVNTGDHEDLDRVLAHTGTVLSVPTASERLSEAGFRTIAVGSGSPGSTLLQAPTAPGPVVNVRGVVRPESEAERFLAEYGAFPAEAFPPDPWNDLACRVFLDSIQSGKYDLGVLWLCDPDFTQHKKGLGAPESLAAIRTNDGRLATLLGAIPEDADLLIASDHGFSTVDPERRATNNWLSLEADRAWFGSSGIYLADPGRDMEETVHVLRSHDWAGPVFTRDNGDGKAGVIAGTYSKKLLHIEHETRSPDIVFSRKWTAAENAYGVPGSIWGRGGTATHGSLSPYDRHAVLMGAGPSFRENVQTSAPSSAVDIAPTLLRLFDLDAKLDGRVLLEGLLDGTDPEVQSTRLESVSGTSPALFDHVDGRTYLKDFEV